MDPPPEAEPSWFPAAEPTDPRPARSGGPQTPSPDVRGSPSLAPDTAPARGAWGLPRFFGRFPRPSATVWGIVLVAVFETAVLSWIQWQNYLGFHSRQGDFGNYSQAFWTTVHGQGFFYYTANIVGGSNGTLWAVHFLPTLVLLVPLYALAPSPVALLVLKQLALALGAIPVYGIARVYFSGKFVPLVFAGLYLISPLTIATDWNNFDPESFIPLTVLVALYFFTVGRFWPFLLAWLLALGTIESTPPILILFCVGALMGTWLLPSLSPYWTSRQQRRPLLIALVVAVVWLGAAYLFLKEAGRGGGFSSAYAVRFTVLGASSFPDVLLRAVTHPGLAGVALQYDAPMKLLFVEMIFLASGAISILGGLRYLFPVVGYLAFAMLSNNATLFVFGSQYPAMFSAFLFVGAIEGAALLWDLSGGLDFGHRHRKLATRLLAETRSMLAQIPSMGLDSELRRTVILKVKRVLSLLSADQLGEAEAGLRHIRRELRAATSSPLREGVDSIPTQGAGFTPNVGGSFARRSWAGARRPNVTTGLRASILSALVIAILVSSAYASPLTNRPAAGGSQDAFGYQPATAQAQALHSVLGLIPPGGSVLTTSHIFPEVSDRPDAYVVNNATGLPGRLTPYAVYNLSNTTHVPGSELPGQDLNFWLNQSQYLALDYWVDPANAVIYNGLTNLSGFGLYAAEDGAYLYERGWTGPPDAWAPWEDSWAGSQLTTRNGSTSGLYASPEGWSYYHPAGNAVGGSLWAGPRLLYLPPGNYSATFNIELQDPAKNAHVKLQVVETPAYFQDYIVAAFSGYSFHNVTIRPENETPKSLVQSKLASAPVPTLTPMSVTLTFSWTSPGFVSFTGTELSTTMSMYLTSINLVENFPYS
jgi:uncharacterized membrane protein